MTARLHLAPGDRIELVSMPSDPDPIEPGSRGTVLKVQRFAKSVIVWMRWDSGRTLSLVIPPDVFNRLPEAS